MAEQQKHPGGRPRLEFDLRLVEDLGRIQTPHAELAAVLGCHVDTVRDRLRHDRQFSEAYQKGVEQGKSSLRRLQWASASKGNIAMQIWLGKQYLGQRDVGSLEVTEQAPWPPMDIVLADPETRRLLAEVEHRLGMAEQEQSGRRALPAPKWEDKE